MLRRLIDLPIWHHPKFGTAARIAMAVVAIELVHAFGDVYNGRVIGASLVSDVFTSFIPMAWLPSAIGLGILANRKSGSLVVGVGAGLVAGLLFLGVGVQLEREFGASGWF